MKNPSGFLLWSLGTLLTFHAAPLQATGNATAIEDEVKDYLAKKDRIIHGVLIRKERIKGSPDGRWTIVISTLKTLKGPRTDTLVVYTLATPPPCDPNSEVLAYASRTKSDKDQLWGSYFPITIEEDSETLPGQTARKSIVVTDIAIPANSHTRRVDYVRLIHAVRQVVADPATGQTVIPLEDITEVFEVGSR